MLKQTFIFFITKQRLKQLIKMDTASSLFQKQMNEKENKCTGQ